ncbi:MAG: helix-turn-helix domain-containing protein [Pseudonocardiaceae bacterium]
MDDAEEVRTIGQRLRRIRKSRGKSLRVIGPLAGMNRMTLQRIESGERAVTLSEVVALASALQIAPSDLMRLPVPAPGNGQTDSTVEAVRCALAGIEHGHPGGQVLPVQVLRDQMAAMRRMSHRYAEVGVVLPGFIRDLHTSISAGRDVAELLALTVKVHAQITHTWLRLAGAPVDLRRGATNLARAAARESGDTALLGVAAYGAVYALLGSGMFDLARTELDSLTLPATTSDTAGLLGSLAITHAYVAAVSKRSGDVAAPMEVAAELALRFGEATGDDAFLFAFGPTDVGLYKMALALESGDPDQALSIAQGVHPEQHPYPARRAAYWVDCGRAKSQLQGQHDDAVLAFRRAESISPHHVQRNPLIRDVLSELLARSRRDAVGRELRGMAYRAGLPV